VRRTATRFGRRVFYLGGCRSLRGRARGHAGGYCSHVTAGSSPDGRARSSPSQADPRSKNALGETRGSTKQFVGELVAAALENGLGIHIGPTENVPTLRARSHGPLLGSSDRDGETGRGRARDGVRPKRSGKLSEAIFGGQ
jgi:hypothetical protein